MCGRPAQPRLRAGGQTALKHGHGTRSTFWGEILGYLWDTLNPKGPEAQNGIRLTKGCGMGGTQTALTSLHVAKGAKISCGESAQS